MSDNLRYAAFMTIIDIGVRELQRDTSRIVRRVQAEGVTYRVTLQGVPTSVFVERGSLKKAGATLAELMRPEAYPDKPPEVVAAQLADLEAGRDRAGLVGS